MDPIRIVITRRKTSRLSMRIGKDGSVRVSAPYFYPKANIDAFIESHRSWMADALVRHQEKSRQRSDFYAQLPLETPAQKRAAKAKLQELVAPMILEYAEKMSVSPSAIGFRASTSRWGSCNVKTKKINFSLYLLLLPDNCIRHIVVHELAHLLVPNHGPRFYTLMNKHFPQWEAASRQTREMLKGNIILGIPV